MLVVVRRVVPSNCLTGYFEEPVFQPLRHLILYFAEAMTKLIINLLNLRPWTGLASAASMIDRRHSVICGGASGNSTIEALTSRKCKLIIILTLWRRGFYRHSVLENRL